jgi:hypothetical protein
MVVIRSNTKAATLNAENCSQFPVPKLSTSMVIVKGSGPYQKKKTIWLMELILAVSYSKVEFINGITK